jgi:hypothetical protein
MVVVLAVVTVVVVEMSVVLGVVVVVKVVAVGLRCRVSCRGGCIICSSSLSGGSGDGCCSSSSSSSSSSSRISYWIRYCVKHVYITTVIPTLDIPKFISGICLVPRTYFQFIRPTTQNFNAFFVRHSFGLKSKRIFHTSLGCRREISVERKRAGRS